MTRLSAGLGLKPAHFAAAAAARADGLWFEVHPENYYADGGPRLRCLDELRATHALSLHGVGLSLGGVERPEPVALERLRALCTRLEPALVSEHLAWSRGVGYSVPDLLPVPRTREALDSVCRNVSIVQDCLARPIAIENPSHYLHMTLHEMTELEFLGELVSRTGCGLLVDVNNVYVSAHNLGFDAAVWLDAVPAAAVHEIHLAGHSADPVLGRQLLIDSHDSPVDAQVWSLYARLIARIGARPTLIERDEQIPEFASLFAEREVAERILRRQTTPALPHGCVPA